MWITGIAMIWRKVTEKLPDHEGSSNFPLSKEKIVILYEKTKSIAYCKFDNNEILTDIIELL